MSITIAELKNRNKDSYQLIDIRDAIEISHGAVPDAVGGSCGRNRDKQRGG